MNSGTVITRTLRHLPYPDVDGVSATRIKGHPERWLVQGDGWNDSTKTRWSVTATPNRYGDVDLGDLTVRNSDYDPFDGIVNVKSNR